MTELLRVSKATKIWLWVQREGDETYEDTIRRLVGLEPVLRQRGTPKRAEPKAEALATRTPAYPFADMKVGDVIKWPFVRNDKGELGDQAAWQQALWRAKRKTGMRTYEHGIGGHWIIQRVS